MAELKPSKLKTGVRFPITAPFFHAPVAQLDQSIRLRTERPWVQVPSGAPVLKQFHGGIAQLGEHLLCKQGVVGSNPSTSTNFDWQFAMSSIYAESHSSGRAYCINRADHSKSKFCLRDTGGIKRVTGSTPDVTTEHGWA